MLSGHIERCDSIETNVGSEGELPGKKTCEGTRIGLGLLGIHDGLLFFYGRFATIHGRVNAKHK